MPDSDDEQDIAPCVRVLHAGAGATLVPQQGYWHSAPDSDHIVSCPNRNACQGNTAALLACQNATYTAAVTLNQVSTAL